MKPSRSLRPRVSLLDTRFLLTGDLMKGSNLPPQMTNQIPRPPVQR